ncbi:hypothetical protein MATL_G00060200 [Megalops atlanticus]|uniref:Cytoskeleton-associated protein 2 C-terminal domain-containing protein n=1 Tax=Megalops atlanticus TaxID=7932 RepID=A0A9D3Q7T5_MEGAT|nr:hypothetical protein MATL_G00060200 [Megalops atlanticus]
MDEHDVVPKLSGPELRKKKLLEYLAAKGKLRPPNPKPYLRDNLIKPQTSVKSVTSDEEKENQEDLKTPARATRPGPGLIGTVPPQSKKKLTAAQEERLRKLQEWRQAKGISYKRPPMPVRQRVKKTPVIPEHYWTAMEEEEEAHSLVCTIDRSLDDCIKLLQEGCPSEQVMEVLSRVPMAKKFAKYWICQARLMERSGNLEVLPLFEEAERVVLEPVDDLRAVVFEIMKKKETALGGASDGPQFCAVGKENSLGQEAQETAGPTTPIAMSAMIRGDKEGSSVVKYKITATPGGRRSQQQESMKLDGQELRFFTPVRRSVRIGRSATRYPAALQEHDPCVASFRDLLAEEEREADADPNQNSPLYIYRANEALKDQVHIQLF